MRTVTQLKALVALSAATAAVADVVPTAPGPGEVFRTGKKCNIEYNLDTTGTWTSFTIQLMTGSNFNMVPVQTVATNLDGTSGSGTVDFTCPDVSPNSAIYFYQYTQAGAPTAWTTRFTIAAADGSSTKPTESTNGIAWGTGQLVGEPSPATSGSGAAAGSAAASSGSAVVASASDLGAVSNSKTRAAAVTTTTTAATETTPSTTSSTTTTTAVPSSSSSMVTSVTSSSSPAALAGAGTLTSLSPAAAIITVSSQAASSSSSMGSAAKNANLNSAAGRAVAPLGALFATGALVLAGALLA